MKLDTIDHIAITVENIHSSTQWYREHLNCQILYQDETWALLEFSNLKLALVSPQQHPPHFAICSDHPERYGKPTSHRDGSESVYVVDPDGNSIELIKYP